VDTQQSAGVELIVSDPGSACHTKRTSMKLKKWSFLASLILCSEW